MNHEKARMVINRTPKDEPVFFLSAKDVLATGLVTQWITPAETTGVNEAKVQAARNDLQLFGGYLDAGGCMKIPS